MTDWQAMWFTSSMMTDSDHDRDALANELERHHNDGMHGLNDVPDCPACEQAPDADKPHLFYLTSKGGLDSCGVTDCGRAVDWDGHAIAEEGGQ